MVVATKVITPLVTCESCASGVTHMHRVLSRWVYNFQPRRRGTISASNRCFSCYGECYHASTPRAV